jgi:ribulose-phosphate 3-epimerase
MGWTASSRRGSAPARDRAGRLAEPARVGYLPLVTLIAPSILSADFGRLASEVQAVTEAGADWIHVDVMDGHFVPPITIGPLVVEAVRRATTLPLDVHLMVEEPAHLIPEFAKAGATRITVHVEACADVRGTLDVIRRAGVVPGLSLNPPTDLARVEPYVAHADLLLVMTVNPGWGGQPIVDGAMERIAAARRLRERLGAGFLIEVDGGIKSHNAADAVRAGADVLVAGSAVFNAGDYAEAIAALRHVAR